MSLLSALLAAVLAFSPETPVRRERVAVSVSDPALEQRLVAELAYLGFEPVVLPPVPSSDPALLDRRAELEDAAVAISQAMETEPLEIVVLDPDRSRAPIEVPSGGPDTRDLAIRTAELVRVTLERARRGGEDRRPASNVGAPPPPELARFGVTAGAAVTGAPGELMASFHLRASIRYMPHRTYGIVLTGTAPLHPVPVTGEEGTADLWFGWVTLGPRFAFRPSDAVVRPELGLGAGLFVLSANGRPAAAYRARESYLVTGIAELSGGLEFAATRRVRFRTMAAIATCFTRPEVRFAGRSRAQTCLPIGLGEVAMTIAW